MQVAVVEETLVRHTANRRATVSVSNVCAACAIRRAAKRSIAPVSAVDERGIPEYSAMMPRLINVSGHLVLRNDIKRPEVLILLGRPRAGSPSDA